jgi:hypothetical protein
MAGRRRSESKGSPDSSEARAHWLCVIQVPAHPRTRASGRIPKQRVESRPVALVGPSAFPPLVSVNAEERRHAAALI